jgi:pimeloyl-ACP methyl ester carboxylesterase
VLVVFVHGLCGNADDTWINGPTGFDLRTAIYRAVPHATILSFDYVSHLGHAPSVIDVAKILSLRVSEVAARQSIKEVRFVAHSLGGIIVREYVLRQQPLDEPRLSVSRIVLLGSPTNGAELATLKGLVPRSRQVAELESVDAGNSYLQSLNDGWNRSFRAFDARRRVFVAAAYEDLPIFLNERVVRMSSAVAYADRSVGFSVNHFDLAKPKRFADDLFVWILSMVAGSDITVEQPSTEADRRNIERPSSARRASGPPMQLEPCTERDSEGRCTRCEFLADFEGVPSGQVAGEFTCPRMPGKSYLSGQFVGRIRVSGPLGGSASVRLRVRYARSLDELSSSSFWWDFETGRVSRTLTVGEPVAWSQTLDGQLKMKEGSVTFVLTVEECVASEKKLDTVCQAEDGSRFVIRARPL